MATATKTKTITFIAKFPGYRQIIDPSWVRRNESGVVYKTHDGYTVEFGDDHRAEIPEDFEVEVDGGPDGEPVKINVVGWLRNYRDFNAVYYEEGAAPEEPKPTQAEQHDAIVKAVARRDLGALEAVRADELDTHNRQSILDAVESAEDNLTASEAGAMETKPSPQPE